MANWATKELLGDSSSPEWQADNLTWIEPVKGQRWQVYKPAAKQFEGMLNDLAKLGYTPSSSGGYNYRNKRGGDDLSQHAFGTAIDLNALTNPMGQSATDIPQAGELADKWDLEWGGRWKNPDPMHFEYKGTNKFDSPSESARLPGWKPTTEPVNPLEGVASAVAGMGGQQPAQQWQSPKIEHVPNPTPATQPQQMAAASEADPAKRAQLVAALMARLNGGQQ